MAVGYTKNFIKQTKKLPLKLRQQVQARLTRFTKNPLHPTLNNHPLKGRYKKYRSINITGDVRALYLQVENEAIFDVIGTHSQLYE
jgi:addiction module RelE/StbE family toxin